MNSRECPKCEENINDSNATVCIDSLSKTKSQDNTETKINCNWLRLVLFFAATNAATVLMIALITQGKAPMIFYGIVAIIGAIFPMIMLLLSKHLAKKVYKIVIINKSTTGEKPLKIYNIINNLSKKAGLPNAPEVGIYESADINAFATGPSRSDSLIAFSSAILENMDNKQIEAVAAHEIAHIANGDMLTSTLLQSSVNSISIVINGIVHLICSFYEDDDKDFSFINIFLLVVRVVISFTISLISLIIMNFFSRHREFAADLTASKLTNPNDMISALTALENAPVIKLPEEQEAYSSFKISSPSAMLDIFSTHPNIKRRIKYLKDSFNLETKTTK